jgi:hypothetical protein
VALARVLHHIRQSAVAVGWHTCPRGLEHLAGWADHILLLDDGYMRHIPEEHQAKVISFHVGPDKWSNPYNRDLLNLLAGMVEEKLHLAVGRF